MNYQPPSINYKINNLPLSSRFKARQFKNNKLNLDFKKVKYDDDKNLYNVNIKATTLQDENYTPFTIHSKLPTDLRKQTYFIRQTQHTQQIDNKQKFLISQCTRRSSSTNTNLSQSNNRLYTKMPAINLPIYKSHQNLNNQEQILVDRNFKDKQKLKCQTKYVIANKIHENVQKRPFRSESKTKRCSCGNCQECMKDFAYYLHMFSDDRGVPQITAKSWCIWKLKQSDKFYYYYGKRIHKVRQIASLTKIITAMVLMDYANKFNFNIKHVNFCIRKSSGLIGGTTAKLTVGQVYTLEQLLYGMMLPSGNDAAIAISEALGLMINLKAKNKKFNVTEDNWYGQFINKNYSYLFIAAMNEKVQRLGTIDTKIFNSHGNDAYDQLKNVSTCNQIAKISSEFIKYPQLRQAARTTQYRFSSPGHQDDQVQNTNKLLEDGFDGIKTGITQTAGPCLAACYKDLIVVVLNSKSMNQRWIQVKKLVKWIKNKH